MSFQWRRIWGAYFAAVGFNNVVPARGGDIIKLFLARSSIPGSTYPTVAAAFFVESVFDIAVGVVVLIFAFTQGVFPKPPDFSKLNSFDISYLAAHFRFTLFLITALAILGLVVFAVLSVRVKAFWARVRQGVTILTDRRRYLREVASLQAGGWVCRFAAFWFLLEAFRVGASVRERAARLRREPGLGSRAPDPRRRRSAAGASGEGLRGHRAHTVVAAYSVGQQIAIAAFTALVGLGAVVFIFRFRSFGEVIAAGRDSREAERATSATAYHRPRLRRRAPMCDRGGRSSGEVAPRAVAPRLCPRLPTEAPRAPRARA